MKARKASSGFGEPRSQESLADAVECAGAAEEDLSVADGGGGAVVGGVAFDAVAGHGFELGGAFDDEDFGRSACVSKTNRPFQVPSGANCG